MTSPTRRGLLTKAVRALEGPTDRVTVSSGKETCVAMSFVVAGGEILEIVIVVMVLAGDVCSM